MGSPRFPPNDEPLSRGTGFGFWNLEQPDNPKKLCYRTKRKNLYRCEKGHVERRLVPCLQLDCWHCATRGELETKRATGATAVARARGAWGRMGGAHTLGSFGLTFPAELHPYLGARRLRWIRRAIAALLRSWFERTTGVEIGVLVQFHPAGSKHGDKKYTPHFHAIVPMVGLRNGEIVEIHPWIDVDAFRQEWTALVATVIAHVNRCDPQAALRFDGEAVFYVKWKKSASERFHALRYMLRPFPAWARAMGTLGRAGSYGLLSAGCKRAGVERYRAHTVGPELERQEGERDYAKCPCGALLHPAPVRQEVFDSPRWALLHFLGVPIRDEDPDRVWAPGDPRQFWAVLVRGASARDAARLQELSAPLGPAQDQGSVA